MKSSKINLLTFNRALSYGAVLQTYSLVKVLESLGFKVEIIDFQAPFLPPKPTGLWTLKTYYSLDRYRKELLFRKFNKEFFKHKTPPFYTLKSLHRHEFNADYYIVGSDQVWNPDITKKFAKTYFLDFIKGTKISYAASFGKSEWSHTSKLTSDIEILLNDFKSISVREDQGTKLLKDTFGINGTSVLDPTLLIDDYSLLVPGIVAEKKQLICFQVNYDEAFMNLASLVQKYLNVPAYSLGYHRKVSSIAPIPYLSVQKWVRSFAEASFILTDSFHGVALSIIFKKQFLVVNSHPQRFIRINDLLSRLGLVDRIVPNRNEIDLSKILNNEIDFMRVDKILKELRQKSFDYLIENIGRV